MTIWFSLLRYNLLDPGNESFAGLLNYRYFLTDPAFFRPLGNSLQLVVAVLVISIVGGTLLALLLDQPIFGRNIVRLMVIAPFFVMPTVSALVWKNMLMHPVSGLFAWLHAIGRACSRSTGSRDAPLTAIIIMVAWQWLPFATLILLTAIQSLDEEQKEAAEMDGTPPLSYFFYIVLPHLARPITVVILIETIFLLNVFAEIYVTGTGGPAGNLPYLVYFQGLLQLRRRRRLGRRHRRGRARQHRRLLPGPDDRQEPGGLRPWRARYPMQTREWSPRSSPGHRLSASSSRSCGRS